MVQMNKKKSSEMKKKKTITPKRDYTLYVRQFFFHYLRTPLMFSNQFGVFVDDDNALRSPSMVQIEWKNG